MQVNQLIKELLTFPMEAEVLIDTDDGMTGNFKEVRRVGQHRGLLVNNCVVLDSDTANTAGEV